MRGLLRLSTVANQDEFDGLVKAMGGADTESVSRHEFECFFMQRELERAMGYRVAATAGDAKAGAAGAAGAAAGGAAKPAAAAGDKAGDAKTTRALTATGRQPTPTFTTDAGYMVPGYVPGVSPHAPYPGMHPPPHAYDPYYHGGPHGGYYPPGGYYGNGAGAPGAYGAPMYGYPHRAFTQSFPNHKGR